MRSRTSPAFLLLNPFPLGNQWSCRHDLGGRRDRVSDPDLGVWTYTFDLASRLLTQKDARDVVTSLEAYDGLSRLTRKCVSKPGFSTEITRNTYDQAQASYANLGKLTPPGAGSLRRVRPATSIRR